MKIILVRPNYDSHIITPPLGLGYLASYLKQRNIDVIIIDALKENINSEKVVEKILSQSPDVVGLTCLTAFYGEVVALSKLIKNHNIKVIIGGTHPTFLPYSTLKETGADYVICGEGEVSFSKLILNNFINNNIPGVYSLDNLRDENQAIIKSEIVTNLDDLPFPDWGQINPNFYPRAPHGAVVKNYPVGIVMTSRGCPYECTFCASPRFYERKIRFRSPENIISEIEYLVKKYGVKEIHFEDDNLTLIKEKVEKICNLFIKSKLNISWACPNGIRADRVDRELIRLMKASGCYYFAYGIESANEQILKNIKKKESIKTIENAIKIADEEGISCQGFFIFGLPGETKLTINESIEFAKKSRLSRAQFLILDILPGSELWETLKGKFAPNWNKKSYKEPEWLPIGLSSKDLLQAQSRAFREFYLRPRIIVKLLRLVDFKQIRYLLKRLADYGVITTSRKNLS